MVDFKKLCKEALKAIKDDENIYNEERLMGVLKHIVRDDMKEEEQIKSVIQVCLELTKVDEPKWLEGAARLYVMNLYKQVKKNRGISKEDPYENFYAFITELTKEGLYGSTYWKITLEKTYMNLRNLLKEIGIFYLHIVE